jgi:ATP-dependent DNA ligase
MRAVRSTSRKSLARKNGERVRLYSRSGNDLTDRFPLIVEALARMRAAFCIIDSEAVCCGMRCSG